MALLTAKMAHFSLFLAIFAVIARAQSSSCIVSSFQECSSTANTDSECKCPCLPKCCPAGHILALEGHTYHGVDCVPLDSASGKVKLPQVPLRGRLESKSFADHRFYSGVFPSCYGIAQMDWKYEVHLDFKLDADSKDRYFLEVFTNESSHKIYSNFDNHGERGIRKHLVQGQTFEKPLMFFCFDVLQNSTTVAVTCPRVTSPPTVAKCCPRNQEIGGPNNNECSEVREAHHWEVPFNGYLFRHHNLISDGKLAYDESKALTKFRAGKCAEKGFKNFKVSDNFHIGADGKLYFTDVHNSLEVENFCVDKLKPEIDDPTAGIYDYDYEDTIYAHSNDSSSWNNEETCHFESSNVTTLQVHYCTSPLTYVRKCCDENENINVRGRSCTDHLAANRSFHVNESFFLEPNSAVDGVHTNSIFSMNTKFLSMSSGEFKLNHGELIYRNRIFKKENYCVDYAIDYCEGIPVPEFRAIINDEELIEQKMTSVFGSALQDGPKMRIFKQVGYIVSVLFLLLTLAIHFIVEDFRKELGGKMVICIAFSLVCVYLCLLIRTFEPDSVGGMTKSNSSCVFLALATYFFTLSTLGWMSAMSYNIMSTFGGAVGRLSTSTSSKRLMVYACYSFGIPSVMTIIVGVLNQVDKSTDPLNGNTTGASSPSWRPGFGEETCWFSSCSQGPLIYLYAPMIIVLVGNIGMFTYAAYVLQRLQKRAGRTGYDRQVSSNPHASSKEPLHRQYSRQLSTVSNVSKSLLKQKANVERLSMYLKLFSAMGLTWVFEVLAWFVARYDVDGSVPVEIQVFVNLFNVLQGIVIFVVFGLKGSTSSKVKQKVRSTRRNKSSRESSSKSCSNAVDGLRQTSLNKKKCVSYSRTTSSSECTEFIAPVLDSALSLSALNSDF